MYSRRRFLLLPRKNAPLAEADALKRIAHVALECLSLRGIVCRTCAEHCEPQAIRFELLPAGRSLPVIAEERCNACGECVRVCPAQAVELRVATVKARAA